MSDWWRNALVYEVYPRSFADADGDGEGDIAGLRRRLGHLLGLGADALWVTPWYPSPMADGGYDVADYRDIDPRFGTLEEARLLIEEAHQAGLKVIIDIVGNHTSSEHAWFLDALSTAPGSRERARYHFADGRGPDGALPPNDWISAFGSTAWTRITEPDGRPGQWYLHTFAPEQPDLNWDCSEVLEEFDEILRFWFRLGVDGVRADAVPAMAKAPGYPDAGYDHAGGFQSGSWEACPHWDYDGVHRLIRRWRSVAEEFPGRMFVAEAVVRAERLADYVRQDEFHTAFNFDFLRVGWDAGRLRGAVDRTLAGFGAVGAAPSWMLSSHDETRHLTRLGREETRPALMAADTDATGDPVLGDARARAAAMLLYALPGMACIYQGEELGLPEVTDLPEESLQDPTWERSGRTRRGRDGCRVPLPWSGTEAPYGFSAEATATWLPQPQGWGGLTVAAQQDDPHSMLAHYRRLGELRHRMDALAGDRFSWLPSGDDALHFRRGEDFGCLLSFSANALELPCPVEDVLYSSAPLRAEGLPPHAALWYRMPPSRTEEAVA